MLSHARIGTLTGACTLLPEPMPPEWLIVLEALDPLCVPQFPPPATSLTAPALTLLPHRSMPMLTGIWMLLPETMPPEDFVFAVAAAPGPGGTARGAGAGMFGWRASGASRSGGVCPARPSGAECAASLEEPAVLTGDDAEALASFCTPWACAGPWFAPTPTAARAGE